MLPPHTIIHLLEQYGYFILFLGAFVEGPIITVIGAFLANQGYFNVFSVFVTVSAGDLTGDLFYYGIGRLGRTERFAGLRRVFRMSGESFLRIKEYIDQHGLKILLVAKYTQTGFLALPACGASHMPIGKFLWYNALGTIPKSIILIVVGYFFGYAYTRIDGYFAKASFVILAIVCMVGASMLLHRYLRVRYGKR
jgi:membrane protein DedA with SNARE-associated domain